MNSFEVVLLNLILITFPLLLYLFYVAYNKNISKKTNNLIFDFSLLTSLYLTIKFNSNLNFTLLMTSIIPLSIAYLRKDRLSIFLLSLFSIIGYYYLFKVNIFFLCIEYSVYYFLYKLFFNKKIKQFNVMLIVKSFIISILLWDYINSPINIILKILVASLITYILFKFTIILLEKGEEIIKYHLSIKELEKEKQIRNSLFKITHEIKNPMAVCKGYFDMMDINNNDFFGEIKKDENICLL